MFYFIFFIVHQKKSRPCNEPFHDGAGQSKSDRSSSKTWTVAARLLKKKKKI
ncbi:hypothetical protein PGB90_003852 [Kerria lacca]